MRRILTLCVLLATAGCGGSSKPSWDALPLGTKADFDDIWFADSMHGWIAGGGYDITGGLVGRTSDGGKTWSFVSNLIARDRASVTSIRFVDLERGTATMSTGTMLETADGGASWTATDRKANSDRLSRKTIFFDDARGWSAGNQASLARTADGGATWEKVPAPVATGEHPNFWDVSFTDSQNGWVVGEEGTMFFTTDGGETWTRRSTGLKDAHSVAKLEHIPTARGTVEIDAGDRTPGFTVSAVRFLDETHGWIAGFYPNFGRSLILRTVDGGATWTVDADIAGEELRALFILGRSTAWAVGSRTRQGPQAIYRRVLAGK